MASTTSGKPVLVYPHHGTPRKPPRKTTSKPKPMPCQLNSGNGGQNGSNNGYSSHIYSGLSIPQWHRYSSCKKIRSMGFGTELQARSSHDALLRLQDVEIRLLETIKKCVTHRIKCDRDYALALANMVTTAQKVDNAEFKMPLFQAWEGIIHETESLIKMIRENADKLNGRTLERLAQLINEKKAARKTYAEERNRLDLDFQKLQDDVNKNKGEYEKLMSKLGQEKAKYEDLLMKGKPGSKFEDAKTRYQRTTVKLHRVHNEYVLSLADVKTHQKQHLRTILPCLLDFQQDLQESLVLQCKEILQEYAELTDTSTDACATCHREMYRVIRSVRPMSEYDTFIDQYKSDPLPAKKFEFHADLLEEYKGSLRANEVAVNDICFEQMVHSKSMYDAQVTNCQQRKKSKKEELQQLDTDLGQFPPMDKMDDNLKNNYIVKKRAQQVLKREITELECLEDKYESLYKLVDEPVTALGTADPPPGLELVDISPGDSPGKAESSTSPSGTSQLAGAGFKTKLADIQTRFKNPFKKPTSNSQARLPAKEPAEVPNEGADNAPQRGNNLGHKPVGPTGDGYQQMTLQPNRRLDEEEWFHGVLPREEVVRLLKNNGDYLVRESKNRRTGETQYVLSVMWGQHKHFIIQGAEDSWRFEGESFPTVQELILHQHKSGLPVTKKSEAILQRPILREDWELRNDDIELGEKIGNGNFGEVFRGCYQPTGEEVAIKTCRETLSDDAKKKFLQEGRILKQYDHINIVRFIGIAAQRQPVMIVMEYVPGGALLTFLRKQGLKQSKKHLIKMCEDAAAGMAYLESKNCIHRDLAARNCLVGKNNGVKISDFGMSREEEMYTVSGGLKQIPIKWTAPEALNFGTYTSACDVWSFGILMWEVFSCGATPYPGFTNTQARERIDEGYRMPAPEGTPPQAYDLMLCAWDQEPKSRPHFEEIYRTLQKIRNTCNS